MNEVIKSKGFKVAALVVAAVLIVLLSFIGGIEIGSRRALFSCQWGENYARNFMGSHAPIGHAGPLSAMLRNSDGSDFRNAHGLVGAIISVTGNNLIIKDRNGKENTVAVADKTIIEKNNANNLKISNLNVNDKVVVMGNPGSSGVVEADLIRVFNNLPPTVQNNGTTSGQNNNPPVAPNNN